MNKDTKGAEKMTERILNYALGIIYLLTGEEYTVVRKNSPHSSIHPLTGEVPIKCDDVAVYFSMEEWEYIEGHKELYKDVMAGKMQRSRIVETPVNKSSVCIGESNDRSVKKGILQGEICSELADVRDDTLDMVLICEEGEDVITDGDVELEEIGSDPSKGEVNTEQGDLCVRSQMGAAEQEICNNNSTGEGIADIVLNAGQAEDLCVRSQLGAPEQEICDQVNTDVRDDNLDMVMICEEDEEVRTEGDVQLEEICSDPSSSGINIGASNIEQVEDVCLRNRLQSSDMDVSEDDVTNEATSKNTEKQYQPTPYFSEDDNSQPQISRETESCSLTEPMLYESGVSASVSHQWEQTINAPSDTFHEGSSEATCGPKRLNSSDINCAKRVHKKAAFYVPQPSHIDEKLPKNKKSYTFNSDFQVAPNRTHTENKSYACPVSDKCFTKKTKLNEHLGNHSRKYVCPECGKGYSQRWYLVTHHRIHTGEKPFVCPVCNKRFTQRSNLYTHQKTHTGEKPFMCPECHMCFTTRSYLNIHQRTHTGTKN